MGFDSELTGLRFQCWTLLASADQRQSNGLSLGTAQSLVACCYSLQQKIDSLFRQQAAGIPDRQLCAGEAKEPIWRRDGGKELGINAELRDDRDRSAIAFGVEHISCLTIAGDRVRPRVDNCTVPSS